MTDERTSPSVYQVLLYYYFTPIANPEEFAVAHRELCASLGLRGRILVAPEGINGTVSGTRESCARYMDAVHADPKFSTMTFKIDDADDHVFRKMFVRVKKELVTFRADLPSDPTVITGVYLKPEDFFQKLQQEDVIILDGRTDYEFDIGHFRGAIRPDVESFREFPQWIREHLASNKHTPILTYCTGGIRCEKLTSFMLAEGFSDVYQLDGGIVTYGKDPKVQGALWDGLCYVFDERVTVPINHTDDRRVVGQCHHCGTPTERYVDCANMACHAQHLCCEPCEQRMLRSCSEACMHAEHREPLNVHA